MPGCGKRSTRLGGRKFSSEPDLGFSPESAAFTAEVLERGAKGEFLAKFQDLSRRLMADLDRHGQEDGPFLTGLYTEWEAMAKQAVAKGLVSEGTLDTIRDRVKFSADTVGYLGSMSTMLRAADQEVGAGVGARAVSELLASKPEGYDASRNAQTAEKQKKTLDVLQNAMRGGGDLSAEMIADLETADAEMRSSPAMACLMDAVDRDLKKRAFKSPSDRMRAKLRLMHERLTTGSSSDAEYRENSKAVAQQVCADLKHKYDVSVAGDALSFELEKGVSGDWSPERRTWAEDARGRYMSVDGAARDAPGTTEYRCQMTDGSYVHLVVPEGLLPPQSEPPFSQHPVEVATMHPVDGPQQDPRTKAGAGVLLDTVLKDVPRRHPVHKVSRAKLIKRIMRPPGPDGKIWLCDPDLYVSAEFSSTPPPPPPPRGEDRPATMEECMQIAREHGFDTQVLDDGGESGTAHACGFKSVPQHDRMERDFQDGQDKGQVLSNLLRELNVTLSPSQMKAMKAAALSDDVDALTELMPSRVRAEFRSMYERRQKEIGQPAAEPAAREPARPGKQNSKEELLFDAEALAPVDPSAAELKAQLCEALADDDHIDFIEGLESARLLLAEEFGDYSAPAKLNCWQIMVRTKKGQDLSPSEMAVDAGAVGCFEAFVGTGLVKKMRAEPLAQLVSRILMKKNTDILRALLRPETSRLSWSASETAYVLEGMTCASIVATSMCAGGGSGGLYSEKMLNAWVVAMTNGRGLVGQGSALMELLMYKAFFHDSVHILAYVLTPGALAVLQPTGSETLVSRAESMLAAVRHFGYSPEHWIDTLWKEGVKHKAVNCLQLLMTETLHFKGGPLAWILCSMGESKETKARLHVCDYLRKRHESWRPLDSKGKLANAFVALENAADKARMADEAKANLAESALDSLMERDLAREKVAALQRKKAAEKKAISEKERKALERWDRDTRRPIEASVLAAELSGKTPAGLSFADAKKALQKLDKDRQEADDALKRSLAWARTVAIPAGQFKEADQRLADANKKSAGKASPWISAEVREQREILGMQLRPPKPAPPSPKPAAPSLKPTPAAPAAPPKLQLPDAVDVAAVAAWESQLLTCDDLAPAAAPKAKNRKQRRAAKQAAVVEDDASERESALSASSTELEAYAALPPTPGSPRPEKKPEPPDELVCAISMELLTDAVMTSTGQCFQSRAIAAFMDGKNAAAGKQLNKYTCPKTNTSMGRIVTPCYPIRAMASAWLEANPDFEA